MFGAKRRFKAYLDCIRPWAMGVDNRGWVIEDFTEEADKKRLDPVAVIFPIKQMWLNPLDMLLLTADQYSYLLILQQKIENFNGALSVMNSARRDLQETYLGLIHLLHVGVIGTKGSGGLHDAFNEAEESLSENLFYSRGH